MSEPLNFSGHETFHCRQFWLKKGYDFLKEERSFTADDAVAHLGVGKNMVTAIRFWMRAFEMADENNNLSDLAHHLLDDKGWDPFLEDIGSLWLLHYQLVKTGHASIARIIFKDLRDRNPEFNAKTYSDFVLSEKGKVKETTLEKDFSVFLRNYHGKESGEIDDLSGLLADLELVSVAKVEAEEDAKRKERKVYYIERKKRPSLPLPILLYAILDSFPEGRSFNLNTLMDPIGKTFALDKDGLYELLSELRTLDKSITVSREASVVELQFTKTRLDRWAILNNYYAR
ncbi:MAG TPA: DUF4007 family protein [Flavobacteriales bacterium]|nr:DUF4007 family protein [Flavobacteriales bacterium]